MISVSRLLCNIVSPGDHLRYINPNDSVKTNQISGNSAPRPVVVWNSTRACNLNCIHCYASATPEPSAGELNTQEARDFIRDIATFKAPVILFSGGEPLVRDDFFELASFAADSGLRVALSTNGTLIDSKTAARLKQIGFAEVGISIDGIGEKNDRFRGQKGAYEAAINGIRNSIDQGLRVSLRITMTRFNYEEVPAIFELAENEQINRICLYHLAYSGRGDKLIKADLSPQMTRNVMDTIINHTVDLHKRGKSKEVLTVGNHSDGVYLYLKLLQKNPAQAARALDLLNSNGGNNSGIRISAVDNTGNVHPDQFWWHYSLGNIRQTPFSRIWSKASDPLLKALRNRKPLLKGRCSKCLYLGICNGNLRVRAEAFHGDLWAPDPSCYLTDEEIGNEA